MQFIALRNAPLVRTATAVETARVAVEPVLPSTPFTVGPDFEAAPFAVASIAVIVVKSLVYFHCGGPGRCALRLASSDVLGCQL